jgi:hypothetical protein
LVTLSGRLSIRIPHIFLYSTLEQPIPTWYEHEHVHGFFFTSTVLQFVSLTSLIGLAFE